MAVTQSLAGRRGLLHLLPLSIAELSAEGIRFSEFDDYIHHGFLPRVYDQQQRPTTAKEYGVHTRFIELAGEINRSMPDHVVNKFIEALNEHGKTLKGARVLLLGIAYKKDVDDLRESPAIELLEKFEARGAQVSYCDPHIPKIPPLRRGEYPHASVAFGAAALRECDVAVITTAHSAFDYALVAESAPLVIDTRGLLRNLDQRVRRA